MEYWGYCLLAWLLVELAFYVLQCWRYALDTCASVPPSSLHPISEEFWYHYASSKAAENAHVDPAFRAVMEDRLIELGGHFGIEDFLSGWFRDAPFETIRRGNVEDFIAYAFCANTTEALSDEDRTRGQALIARVENTFNTRFKEGRNPDIKFMAHLWEPLRWIHTPLALYLAAEAAWAATGLLLRVLGFRPFTHSLGIRYWMWSPLAYREVAAEALAGSASTARAISSELVFKLGARLASDLLACLPNGILHNGDEAGYLYASKAKQPQNGEARASLPMHLYRHLTRRPSLDFRIWKRAQSFGLPTASKSAPENSPIVFLHGVGLGLTPYLQLIHEITCAFRTRPVILLEGRHVSVCLARQALTTDDMAAAVKDILHKHGWSQAAFIGHSYGTFVLSRIAQVHKHIIQSMVLIDPVCILTIYPQLLRNFLYKMPNLLRLTSMLGSIDWMRYVFSRDLMIAESFCRKLVWHRECLWPQDLPPSSLLVLEAADDLVPCQLARAVHNKLEHPCDVVFHPTAGHGGFIFDTAWRRQILVHIRTAIASGAKAAHK